MYIYEHNHKYVYANTHNYLIYIYIYTYINIHSQYHIVLYSINEDVGMTRYKTRFDYIAKKINCVEKDRHASMKYSR
jgi:hypothetical protein